MSENNIFHYQIDGVSFSLRSKNEFSFLKTFGKIFCVFDQNDSGNISFGIEDLHGKKIFIKIAGATTLNMEISPEQFILHHF